MGNQFFFTRISYGPPEVVEENGEKKEIKRPIHWTDSFNLDLVIRTREFVDHLIVLLNDGHEEAIEVPEKTRDGKINMVRKREWLQSEIQLYLKEDIDRYRKVAKFISPGEIIHVNPDFEFSPTLAENSV